MIIHTNARFKQASQNRYNRADFTELRRLCVLGEIFGNNDGVTLELIREEKHVSITEKYLSVNREEVDKAQRSI